MKQSASKVAALTGLALLAGALWLGVERLSLVTAQSKPIATNANGLQPYVTWGGRRSKITQRGYYRITSMKEWAPLWHRHIGEKKPEQFDEFYNPGGVPRVDFTRCEVLAIFLGKGYNTASVEIQSIVARADGWRLRFGRKLYQVIPGPEPVTAFGIWVLPRTPKTLVLEEYEFGGEGTLDDPIVWKERARLSAP